MPKHHAHEVGLPGAECNTGNDLVGALRDSVSEQAVDTFAASFLRCKQEPAGLLTEPCHG